MANTGLDGGERVGFAKEVVNGVNGGGGGG